MRRILIVDVEWKVVESLSNIYWKRFIKVYVPLLNVTKKWNKVQWNVKVYDVVLLYDCNMPSSFWPLAWITRVDPSKDELVLSVILKPPNTTCIRTNSHQVKRNVASIDIVKVDKIIKYNYCIKRREF